MLAGVVPDEGVTESQLLVELVASVKGNCTLGSELVSTNGFGGWLERPNPNGAPPDCRVTDCNPVGIDMLSNALVLTKRVTPTSVVVVPFVGVFELNVMFPVHVPAVRPAVLMLTLRVAGVELVELDRDAVNQLVEQLP